MNSIAFDIIARDRASGTFDKVARASGQTESKLSKLGGSFKKMGAFAVAGAAVAGAATAKFAFDAIGAASDLNETVSKSSIIFGKNFAAIDKWAKGGARSMGLSRQAALEAASGFGDMFLQLGFASKAAAGMSRSTVQMAADLGSFNNLPTADVAERISAAFRGEYDSLQLLIPNINAARVEQEALAATGKTVASELTAQEKAAAVLAIVHKDGARAAGDFARTSDGLANQQKILSAQFDNVKASLGQKLLPVAVTFTTWLNDKAIPFVRRLGNWLRDHLGPAFRAVGEFIREKAIPAAREFISWYVEKIVPGLQRTVKPILEGIRSLFAQVAAKVEENRPALEKLRTAFQRIAEFMADKVLPVIGALIKVGFKALGVAISGVIVFVSNLATAFDKVIGKIQDLIGWIKNIPKPNIDLPDLNPFRTTADASVGPIGPRGNRGPRSGLLSSGSMYTLSPVPVGGGDYKDPTKGQPIVLQVLLDSKVVWEGQKRLYRTSGGEMGVA